MALPEYEPGRSKRIQLLGDGGRCSTVWSVFTARKSGDLYVTPRMLGGAIKVSLHESGSWQVGFTSEYNGQHRPAGTRHWDIWKNDLDLGQGVRRAWYLLVPDEGLGDGYIDDRAHKLPSVGPGHAVSLEFLMMSNEGPEVAFDDAHIVGRWKLAGRDESCLVVARRVRWLPEQQASTEQARISASADIIRAGIRRHRNHRFYFHGHDNHGVRYGIETAVLG